MKATPGHCFGSGVGSLFLGPSAIPVHMIKDYQPLVKEETTANGRATARKEEESQGRSTRAKSLELPLGWYKA